jgi:hypothetical protein
VEPFSETEKCKLKMIEEVSLKRKGHLEVTEFGDKKLLDYVCTE